MTDLRSSITAPELSGPESDRFVTGARISSAIKSDDFVLKVLLIGMLIAVVTQKVALPVSPGKIALQVTLLVQYGIFALLAYGRRLTISMGKFVLFALFGGLAVLMHLIRGLDDFSLPSLVYVLMIYVTYVFSVPLREETFFRYLRGFQILAVGACGMVFLDWAFQVAHLEMPNMEHFIPKLFQFFNYVYIQPLEWGARYMKPNGFFFLETSYVSQFIAFGLVMELCLFQRFRYIAILGLGQVCSFGGTGMTLVLFSTPVILYHFRLKMLPLLLISAPVVGYAAFRTGLVENVAMRSQEFSHAGSSGNQRFNVQYERVVEVLQGSTTDALIGVGAGKSPQYLNMMWTPVSKILVEYGLFTYVAFWAFFFVSMFGRGVPFVCSWIMIIQYIFLNGSFLVPINSFFDVMLASLFVVQRPGRSAPGPLRTRLRP